jgi:hypothetical protein
MRTPGAIAFTAAVAIAILMAVLASLALAFLAMYPGTTAAFRSLPDHPWWFTWRDPPQAGGESASPLWTLAAAILAACVSVPAALRARSLFRNGSPPMGAFLILFLLSLNAECLRAGSALLVVTDRSVSAAILFTRAVYWARFAGLMALLSCGLYALDLKYRRPLAIAVLIGVVSFAIAAYIPIDRTVFLPQLTWKLGDELGVWFVSLVIGALTLASLGAAAVLKKDRGFFVLMGGFGLLLIARELLFFAVRPAFLGLGLFSLAGGVVTCLRMFRRKDQAMERPGS